MMMITKNSHSGKVRMWMCLPLVAASLLIVSCTVDQKELPESISKPAKFEVKEDAPVSQNKFSNIAEDQQHVSAEKIEAAQKQKFKLITISDGEEGSFDVQLKDGNKSKIFIMKSDKKGESIEN